MLSYSRTVKATDEDSFKRWCFQEIVEIERKRQELQDEIHEFNIEKRNFYQEQETFLRQKEYDTNHKKKQENLFQMKFHILETELKKLASEKEHFERQKAFYNRVEEYEKSFDEKENITSGKFFAGIHSKEALKKRYHDLIKIFHPDNFDGDTTTLQEINREYDSLCKEYAVS